MAIEPKDGRAAAVIYRRRYCEQVAAFMGRGYSLTAFAGEIGVSRAILLKWCDKHPNFAAAVDCARARRARLLEDRLLAAKGAGAFGANLQALKAAAPDEWPDGRASNAKPTAPSRKPEPTESFEPPDNGRD